MSGARPEHNRRWAGWLRRAQAGNQEERATRADHTRRCQARRAVMTDANDEPAATEPDKPNQTPPKPAGSPQDFSLRGSTPLVTRSSSKAMAVIGSVLGVGLGGLLISQSEERSVGIV